MNNLEHTDLWTALEPTYVMMKYTGNAQLEVTGPCNKRHLQVINFCSLYKLTSFFITALFITIFLMQQESIWSNKSQSVLQKYTKIYLVCGTIFLIVSAFFATYAQRFRALKLYKKIAEIDRNIFCKLNETIDNRRGRNLSLISIAFFLINLILMCLSDIDPFDWQSCLSHTIYFFVCIHKVFVSILYRSWIFIMMQRFYALHNCLKHTKMKNIDIVQYVTKIKCIQHCHYDLCSFLRKFDKSGFVSTGLNLTMNFVIIVTYSFYFILLIKYSKEELYFEFKCFQAIIGIFMHVIDTWLVIFYSHILGAQVSIITNFKINVCIYLIFR